MASPTLSTSTVPTSIASHDEELVSIQFTSIKELHQSVRHAPTDFLVVQNVSPAIADQIFDQEKRPFRIRRYHVDSGVLLITIPTSLHEALHSRLFYDVTANIIETGLRKEWKPLGSATYRPQGHPRGDGGGDCGEPDSCGGPEPARCYRGCWPTIVIEAGYSESLNGLRDDMRWWFSASNYDVNIVLLIKFDYHHQNMIIERWGAEPQARAGVVTRRAAAVLRQSITITRDATTDSYHVTRNALVLPFRLLFLRDPGSQEGDIIISIRELEDYARFVWGYA